MDKFMDAAIEEAELGLKAHGIPIGSVLVHKGAIIGRGHNQRVQKNSVVLHAEMDALENAGRLPAIVYRQSILYTTLSPCAMCSGTIIFYKMPTVIIGENVTLVGEEELLKSKGVDVKILNDKRCIQLMSQFIRQDPKLWDEDSGA